MIEGMNKLLEHNDVQVRIGSNWYRLDEIHVNDGKMPIFVSDDNGEDYEFDMADIDEIDPIFDILKDVNSQSIMGVA